MDIGFATLGNLKWSLEKWAEALAANGYQSVEIRGRKGEHLGPEEDAARRAEVKHIFADQGVAIAGITAYSNFVNRDKHADNLAELRSYLPLAQDIGAQYVRTFGGNLMEGQTRDDAVAALVEALSQIAPDAEAHGIKVVLETHDGFSHSDMVRDVMAAVGSPFVGALWDVHHPFRHGESWEDSYANLKDSLVCLHVKDAMLMPDDTEQLVLMGAGRVPVGPIMKQLADDGFTGPVVVEWEGAWHPELPECDIAIPQHMQKLSGYLSTSS